MSTIENSEYWHYLSNAYAHATVLVNSNDPEAVLQEFMAQEALVHPLKTQEQDTIVPLGKTVAEGVSTIVNNIGSNKYLYSVLITAFVQRLVDPTMDVRNTQTIIPGGYSNRSQDQMYVTPFLKRHDLTHCQASGFESGRNLERGIPLNFDHTLRPQGKGNKQAFLSLLYAIAVENIDPEPVIVLLMALDRSRRTEAVYSYVELTGLTVQQIIDAVLQHHQDARGQGTSRLPVLAIQAAYQCLTPELTRYIGTTLRPVARHTANDKKGSIGDIQVDRNDGTPFEGVEVKSNRKITPEMVRDLPQKFAGKTVSRYYILSTEGTYIEPAQTQAVQNAVNVVRENIGCEVIVNGLNRTLWYYLRLLSDPIYFFHAYTELVKVDEDIQDIHRAEWAAILSSLTNKSHY